MLVVLLEVDTGQEMLRYCSDLYWKLLHVLYHPLQHSSNKEISIFVAWWRNVPVHTNI